MDLGQVLALNGELTSFVAEVFVAGQPVRGAQRRAELWAHYLRGSLLTDVTRKTATGMGRVLGVPTQSLSHLVTDSPWRWEPVLGAGVVSDRFAGTATGASLRVGDR